MVKAFHVKQSDGLEHLRGMLERVLGFLVALVVVSLVVLGWVWHVVCP